MGGEEREQKIPKWLQQAINDRGIDVTLDEIRIFAEEAYSRSEGQGWKDLIDFLGGMTSGDIARATRRSARTISKYIADRGCIAYDRIAARKDISFTSD